jgi:anti-sigma factor RsiW
MTAGELTCQELVELITDYLEGAMPVAEQRQFEEHLRHCAACHTYVEQARLTISLTGKLAADAIAPEERDVLTELFRSWRRTA